jgi:translation initiation factor 4A
VGTPGRIMDMINKRALEIKYIKYVIIDEADEMLSLGFVDQIKTIFNSLVSNNLQVGLYSATMPTEFFKISDRILRNPVKILVKKEELTLEGIKQFYVNVERIEHKFEVICDLYSNISINQSIIYCNSKKTVVELARRLNMNNFSVTAIHSDLTHSERVGIIKDFREGKSRILLSTDLLSRGIDVQQVSIVLNYDIPYIIESYIHRIGRSGRFGRKGVAINIITYQDIRKLHDIEKFYGTQIEELPENFSTYL